MDFVNLPSIRRALPLLLGPYLALLPAVSAPALAQESAPAPAQESGQTPAQEPAPAPAATAAPDPTAGTPVATPAMEVTMPSPEPAYVPRRRYWTQGDRITFTVLAAGVPGSGQLLQGRWLEGSLHLGGAVALGTLGFVGWASNNDAAKWISALGLLGLSVYSPFDAYFAIPPEIPGPGGRR